MKPCIENRKMRYIFFWCGYISLFNINSASSAKILVASIIPAHSHQVVIQPIVQELSQRGHEVTFITPKPIRNHSLKSYREININFTEKIFIDVAKYYLSNHKTNHFLCMAFEDYGILSILKPALEYKQLRDLVNSEEEKFDLVLFEAHHPLLYGFGGRFNCPMIGILSHFADVNTHFLVNNHYWPVTNPDMRLGYTRQLTFFQRIHSVLFSVLLRLRYKIISLPYANFLAQKYFGKIPHLRDLENNVSLILTRTHPLLDGIHANKPTMIELGKIKKLSSTEVVSKDLLDFIDTADNGFIYFSLGSLLIEEFILSKKLSKIIKAFAEIPEKVVWVWKGNFIGNITDNVNTFNWIPQEFVLNHRNCKAFITPGGSNSIEEAIHSETPVLIIPLQYEQFYIAEKVTEYGIGRTIDIDELETNNFKDTLFDLTTNSKYLENIKKLKVLVKDYRVDGLESAMWWIEYVIRHKGAKHLRSSLDNIPFYQYYMLDILFFFASLIALSLFIIRIYCTRNTKLKYE